MLISTATEAALEETEAQRIARCRAGDLEAFAWVYNRYERLVFRHAFYLLGHRDDAEDVVQETFLRAHRALGSFRSDSSLKTWLLRICTNLCHTQLRTRQRHPQLTLDPETLDLSWGEEAEKYDPVRVAERMDSLRILLRVLQGLPLPDRSVIALHLVEGLDYGQIAEVLGCARGSAKMRVLRAVRRFKERVAAYLEERS